jgi:hypothetical protein
MVLKDTLGFNLIIPCSSLQGVVGLFIWAQKGFFMEKMRRKRADDQMITSGELGRWCFASGDFSSRAVKTS